MWHPLLASVALITFAFVLAPSAVLAIPIFSSPSAPIDFNLRLDVADPTSHKLEFASAERALPQLLQARSPTDTTTPMIQFDLDCRLADPLECNAVSKTLAIAGSYLSSTLDLKRPIRVTASYLSFCNATQNTNWGGRCEANLLGRAGATSYWASPSGVLYPQALAKQLAATDLQWQTYDIAAVFNADGDGGGKRKYWFPSDQARLGAIGSGQYDFLFVAMHEMVHGLGMVSGWGTYFSDPRTNGSATLPLLTPPLGTYIVNPQSRDDTLPNPMTVLTQVAGGSSSSSSTSSSSFGASDYAQELIFDTLVYDAPRRTSPTTDARPDIVTAPSSRLAGSTDPSTLPAPAAKAAAERMYQRATTPRTLVANLTISGQPLVPPPPPTSASDDDGSYAILDTSSRPFDMGSSMSHVDGALYEGTRNALMRPRGVKGQPLGVAVVGGDTDPLGPVVRGILARMGYSVRDESELGQEWVAYANPAVARAAPRNSDWVQASSAPSSLAGGWARSVVIGVGIVLASGMWI